jgi:hypothetical protein
MGRTPQSSQKQSAVVAGSLILALGWEAVGIAHKIAYVRELFHDPPFNKIIGLIGHAPPLAIVGFALVWLIVGRRKANVPARLEKEPVPGQGDVYILRERTTTTTTEREVVYRRG